MKKSTLLKAAALTVILSASAAAFVAQPISGARADRDMPDLMATEFVWTQSGARNEPDYMATEFLWVATQPRGK